VGATTHRAAARPARRRLTREERSAELISTAEAIVLEDGADHLTLERLAEEAGCSRNLAYSYFPNMGALRDAMRDRQRARLVSAVHEKIPRPASFDVWMDAWIDLVLDEASEHGPLFLMLFDGSRTEERRAMSLDTVAGVEQRLQQDRGMAAARARVVARLVTGAILAAAIAIVVDGSPRSVVDDELRGLVRHLV
jgi:AcrR family transcriptional regulator